VELRRSAAGSWPLSWQIHSWIDDAAKILASR
jgi:hypothetical protein